MLTLGKLILVIILNSNQTNTIKVLGCRIPRTFFIYANSNMDFIYYDKWVNIIQVYF